MVNEMISEQYIELQKKYPDKWVAISENKVIASGDSFGKVRAEAKQKAKAYVMEYILSGDLFVF